MSKTAIVIGAVGLAMLGIALVVPLALVSVSARGPGVGGEQGGIMVVGEGKALAEPDLAMITIGVETRASTAQMAAAENNERMSEVMEALDKMGIAEEDIRTVDYSIRPEIDWRGDERRLIGYVVSNSVRVKIREVEQVGQVLDGVTAAGANDVFGIQFTFDDPTELEEQARAEAVADAESKAQALATLGGVGLGKPRIITESFVDPPIPYLERAYAPAMGEGGGAPVSPGQLEVTVQVQMTFDIR